jgi:site-specific recombinase XerD
MDATLAEHVPAFLDHMARVARLRPHTLRAYRYELTAAAVALTASLDQLTLTDLERWASRGQVAPSTIARRTSSPRSFTRSWASRRSKTSRSS